MNTTSFSWQPIRAIPFFCRVSGDVAEHLPTLRTVFGRQEIDIRALEGSAHVWSWEVDRDEKSGRWKVSCDEQCFAPASDGYSNPENLVVYLEYSAVSALQAQQGNQFFGLHSALLSKNGKAIAVIGSKEAGKTTLSCALWKHGWHLHADDFTILDTQYRPHANPRRVSIRNSSRELLGEQLWATISSAPSHYQGSTHLLFHPIDLATDATPIPKLDELDAIIFLGRPAATVGVAEIEKQPPATTIFSILPHSTLLFEPGKTKFESVGDNLGEALSKLAALVDKVPVYDLGRGPLDQMVAQIEGIFAKPV